MTVPSGSFTSTVWGSPEAACQTGGATAGEEPMAMCDGPDWEVTEAALAAMIFAASSFSIGLQSSTQRLPDSSVPQRIW